MAATGVGAGTALFAFTPIGLIWALLAVFAVAGAVGAIMRVVPRMTGRPSGPTPRRTAPSGS